MREIQCSALLLQAPGGGGDTDNFVCILTHDTILWVLLTPQRQLGEGQWRGGPILLVELASTSANVKLNLALNFLGF